MYSVPLRSEILVGLLVLGCAPSGDEKADRPVTESHDNSGEDADGDGDGDGDGEGDGDGDNTGGLDDDASGDTETGPGSGDGGVVDGDDATLVSASLPRNMTCGEELTVSVTMRNTGSTVWTRDDSYKLGMVDDEDPFYGPDTRVWLPEGEEVPSGHLWIFTFEMTAPTEAGSYQSDWQMVRESVAWFGDQVATEVNVVCDDPGTGTGGEWTEDACARNGAEICDDEVFGVEHGRRYGLKCAGPEGGIAFISSNTGPEMSDGMERCQGWEERGDDAWDHLDYVESFVCNSERIVEVDLSAWSGGHLWFGSHDHPGGGGHMTNACLVSQPE